MNYPLDLLNRWLSEEQQQGAPNPQQAVLATATTSAVPHGRVVAIREITNQGLVFFTQRGTRKVTELEENPRAAMIFWFELNQRQVLIEGTVTPLAHDENVRYWQSYPREAQVRFMSYAPTSAQPITSKQVLEAIKKQIEQDYQQIPLPMSAYYYGFLLQPERMVFYSYRADALSDVIEYQCSEHRWIQQLLSP
jgi:pyridoxamine 5'-phosphate oxidase